MIKKNIHNPILTEDYKVKSEEYLEVIEAQKVIIKRLQKSIVSLKRKNEDLEKQNRELQGSYTNTPHLDNSVVPPQSDVLQHPLDQQTLHVSESHHATPNASKSTPILPPKSPYRQNHELKPSKPNAPRRPPFLKLANSNYTSLHSNVLDIQKEQLETNTTLSSVYQPLNPASDPSSPSSSASSSSTDNSPLSDHNHLSSSLPKFDSNVHPTELVSPRYSSVPKSQVNRQMPKEPVRHSTNSTPYMNKSKSEPSTPVKPRTPRFDSLLSKRFPAPTTADNKTQMADVNVKVMSYSLKTCHRGREASVFTIGLFRKEDSAEIWRVEKSLSDLILLDSTVGLSFKSSINLCHLQTHSLYCS